MQQLVLELAPPAQPTLENFFPGANAAAVAALREAVRGGERLLYFWGETGSGKTHLARAAVREALRGGKPALYVGAPHAGLTTVSAHALLAVDDVERLDPGSQQLLFEAFNAFGPAGGCVVAAGRPPAAELPVREDLRTRLGSGVSIRLSALDDGAKAVALAQHASQRGLALGAEVIAYLLTHCRRDMGTQVAVLEALDRYSLARRRPLTLPLAREALAQLDAQRPSRP